MRALPCNRSRLYGLNVVGMPSEPTPKRHLSRLTRVWIRDPIYFITTNTLRRLPRLDNPTAHEICREVWDNARGLYGWQVGRYVLMPDHAHFFCAPAPDAKPLEVFVGKWKEWTAKYLHRRNGEPVPFWQAEFFDHILRSSESYSEKWDYVWRNPAGGGLVADPENWPYQGCLADWLVNEVERL
jgi:putative transposase